MRKLKVALMASLLVCAAGFGAVGSLAQTGDNTSGPTWENPTLPLSTSIDTNSTEEIRIAASNASENLTVSVTDGNGTEVNSTTLVNSTEVKWVNPGNGTWTVEVSGETTGTTVDNLTIEAAENAPAGGGGGGAETTESDDGALIDGGPLAVALLVAVLASVGMAAYRRS